ncbi:hypothetical protein MMA231_03996 (plasmid) [Asticcacaulis sp. MM231]|uniref:hypothetical protein n=1 Tax=Asticcacaulis sp. MM231 TaxID=3157666 RepID=UPI0032D58C8A
MDNDLEKGLEYTRITVEISATEMGQAAIRGAEGLNDKTSALLSHVSIMVAISSLLLFQFGHSDEKYDVLLLFELLAYLFICMLCLSAIWASSAASYKSKKFTHLENLIVITTRRRKRYQLALYLTSGVTAVLILSVILNVWGVHLWLDFHPIKQFVAHVADWRPWES